MPNDKNIAAVALAWSGPLLVALFFLSPLAPVALVVGVVLLVRRMKANDRRRVAAAHARRVAQFGSWA